MKHILVGLDGSTESEHALSVAVGLAQRLDARVTLASVYDAPQFRMEDYRMAAQHHRSDELEARMAMLIKKAAGFQRLKADVVLETGHPAQMIADTAERIGADLVVVGTRGLGRVSGMLLGSVSARVLELCRCPVMVVPPPEK